MNSVTVSVSGTISFKCTDVYVELGYGIEGDTTKQCGPYYSQPGETVTWKDSKSNTVTIGTDAAVLPALAFDETSQECTYYVTVKNLNGMDIYFNFGYKFTNNTATATNNAITATAKVYNGNIEVSSCTFDGNGILASRLQVTAQSVCTLKVTLKLTNTEYKAGGTINLASAAALESSGASISWN